jgi:uncharacterized protein (DUF488 family)
MMSSGPPAAGAATIWTVGHSVRPIEEFLDLLVGANIQLIADVRAFPGSRRFPQFGKEPLTASLAARSIGYHWLPSLGGRRRAAADSRNTAWRNASFRGYADYMATPKFAQGLGELLDLSERARTAVMCSEALWWRCHRSLIADALCVGGTDVVHILGANHVERHPMTAPARVVDGVLTYAVDAPIQMRLPD